jgi:hypothetical protein
MSLKQIFFEKEGKPSIKRITGFTMITNGLLGKNILALTAMFISVNHYVDIDSTFNGLLMGGIALIFGSIVDKFTKK